MSYSSDPSPLPPPTGDEFEDFTSDRPSGYVSAYRRKKQTPGWLKAIVWGGVGLVVVVGAVVGYLWYVDQNTTLKIPPLAKQTTKEMVPFKLHVPIKLKNIDDQDVEFSLKDAPAGVTVDAKTGEISWTPTEEQGPGHFEFTLYARAEKPRQREDHTPIVIDVTEAPQQAQIMAIEPKVLKAGEALAFKVEAKDPDSPAHPLNYRLFCNSKVAAKIDQDTGEVTWTPKTPVPGMVYRFTVQVTKADGSPPATSRFDVRIDDSGMAAGAAALVAQNGQKEEMGDEFNPLPLAVEDKAPPASAMAVSENDMTRSAAEGGKPTGAGDEKTPEAMKVAQIDFGAELLKLREKKQLTGAGDYNGLRRLFADYFQQQYATQIKQGYGAELEEMNLWLIKFPEIKEEFYAAIDPERDDLVTALGLMRDLKKQYEEKLPQYINLAIAVCVTWDQKKNIYDYTALQKRFRAKMPTDRCGGVENFKFIFDAEQFMQNRGQMLPWEYLMWVVDHSTPIGERQWALIPYLPKRTLIGKCYNDVPLDAQFALRGENAAKLKEQDYTLANLAKLGGNSQVQADFAARVAKTVGVPAAYVSAKTAQGEDYAWVVWAEVGALSKTSMAQTFESQGRSGVETFYVGKVYDPQTGAELTDRLMELRLRNLSLNAQAARQANLLMRAYPVLVEKAKLSAADQLAFLGEVLKLCPAHDLAWETLCKLGKSPDAKTQLAAELDKSIDVVFKTFASYPDFVAANIDSLTAYKDDPTERRALLKRLVDAYEQAKRPDLAFDARIKLTDALVKAEKQDEALDGLIATIKKFPDAANYVPKLLDKMDGLAESMVGARAKVLDLYQQLLPAIPTMQGNKPSRYCMDMLERGVKRFKDADQKQQAATFQAALDRLKAQQ